MPSSLVRTAVIPCVASGLVVSGSAGAAGAEPAPCEPSWAEGLFPIASINGPVRAMAVFDPGTGPALILGHDSDTNMKRWTGTDWESMPLMSGDVYALVTGDDGGPALFAGGEFTTIEGGLDLNHVGKWDGASWSALGPGLNDAVRALAIFDDGTGPALCAGGDFFEVLFEGIHCIAKWDGVQWTPLNTGLGDIFNDLNDSVHALAVFDDGTGEALYAGGEFTLASGVTVNRIARWDGTEWSALGAGVDDDVYVLGVHDDGTGDALYVGGAFTHAGGTTSTHIARWDGSSWTDLAGGTDGEVHALWSRDDGNGAVLWVGGGFHEAGGVAASLAAIWDGSTWSQPGDGLGDGGGTYHAVYAWGEFDGVLHAGGDFALPAPGTSPNQDLARWTGDGWEPMGLGVYGNSALGSIVFDDGGGPDLYVGGEFGSAGGVSMKSVGRWDGTGWSPLAAGLGGRVEVFEVYDDGTGDSLYAAGQFLAVNGGPEVHHIARWDGTAWSGLAGGIPNAQIRALEVFADSGEPELYVGGAFQGEPANWIARWNGTSWSAVGGGVDGAVAAMVVHDDGTGAALYVGGGLDNAGGNPVNGVARWDGAEWTPLGSGVEGSGVSSLCVFDDGSGPALYAGGNFTVAGGVPAPYLARWDGSSWAAVGGGTDGVVLALCAFEDSLGPALFVGGDFTTAGALSAPGIARWDGTAWSQLGEGMDSDVRSITPFDDGEAINLYAFGQFNTAGGFSSSKMARWNTCVPACPWDLDGSGDVGVTDFLGVLAAWATDPGGPPDFDGDGTVGVTDFLELLAHWGPCP